MQLPVTHVSRQGTLSCRCWAPRWAIEKNTAPILRHSNAGVASIASLPTPYSSFKKFCSKKHQKSIRD